MTSTALFRTEAERARQKLERSGPVAVQTSFGTVQLRITNDLQSVETMWERLQAEVPCTSAQTFDWAQAFARHVLAPEGREPVIVVGLGVRGEALFLWAFEMTQRAGTKVLAWLGQDYANYNMGLFAPDTAASFSASDISRLLNAVARRTGAAAAILKAQPFTWDGMANPFAQLPHQPTPSSGYAVTLGDFTALYEQRFGKRSRHTLARKERRLMELGTPHYGWAETHSERLELIDIFFAQKARQFALMGIKDIFDAHARAFYREVALLEDDNAARLRLGYVKLGDEVLAIFSGTTYHNRFIVLLCSLAEGETQKYSPGALLLRHQIDEACAKRLAVYDMGAGAAAYKDQWCDVVQPLFDSFIALKPHGLLATVPLATGARIKRAIKSNPHLWPLAQKIRARLFGKSRGQSPSNGSDASEEA
jgi:CelD/BcsL family acetyltransferase involved in cellulose biosynthesis